MAPPIGVSHVTRRHGENRIMWKPAKRGFDGAHDRAAAGNSMVGTVLQDGSANSQHPLFNPTAI